MDFDSSGGVIYIEQNSDYDEKGSLKMFPLGQQTGSFLYLLVPTCWGKVPKTCEKIK